jgi:hypothetical protein
MPPRSKSRADVISDVHGRSNRVHRLRLAHRREPPLSIATVHVRLPSSVCIFLPDRAGRQSNSIRLRALKSAVNAVSSLPFSAAKSDLDSAVQFMNTKS